MHARRAPEQLKKEADSLLGPACDIWGFGCTLLHMLTGTPPRADHNACVGVQRQAPPVPPTLSALARNLLGRCLQAEESRRPTAAALAAQLQAVLSARLAAAQAAVAVQHAAGGAAPVEQVQPPAQSSSTYCQVRPLS